MLRRTGKSVAYAEHEDGEHEYVLRWTWTRPRPATYWEPAEGGLEPEDWYRDGEPVSEAEIPREVVDELLADAHDQTFEERYYGT